MHDDDDDDQDGCARSQRVPDARSTLIAAVVALDPASIDDVPYCVWDEAKWRVFNAAVRFVKEAPTLTTLQAAAPDLLEAVRAGGRYSDALLRYQEQGVRGQMIPPTDELERLFLEWHTKGHAAIAKAEGRDG